MVVLLVNWCVAFADKGNLVTPWGHFGWRSISVDVVLDVPGNCAATCVCEVSTVDCVYPFLFQSISVL